ncbi:hypothetical protein PQE66_gp168 [Bacillus phage PBC2]|uniref:Uncharacterized protein n=1 Tax=Bacillus phage PBC2 TaxID=1675029 RepID=A0A218KC71_9CAUD|nr:hypothetical protein PQE66_gp168 [Bacillus phage PBC2]AKQ08483.1 hypothetical protein PBC2_168 [Bacillus phage PBC2]
MNFDFDFNEYNVDEKNGFTHTGESEENVNMNECGHYKVGDVVEIVDNVYGHGFKIGEHIRVTTVDEFGFIYYARSLKDNMRWAVHDTEVVEVERVKKEEE